MDMVLSTTNEIIGRHALHHNKNKVIRFLTKMLRFFLTESAVLYFVSPRERPWHKRVVQNNTLIIARVTSLFSHSFKRNPGIDAQMLRFTVFILWRTEWRHGRSRDKTKYIVCSTYPCHTGSLNNLMRQYNHKYLVLNRFHHSNMFVGTLLWRIQPNPISVRLNFEQILKLESKTLVKIII